MAIVFTSANQEKPINAYNNSIVEFEVDAGTPRKAIIEIEGYNFEIAPNAQGKFYFNLKEIITNLINFDHFSDDIEVSNGQFVFLDENLFYFASVQYKVILDDGTELTSTRSYSYIKSVEQLFRKRVSNIANEQLKILSPCNDQTAHLTMFEGLPFDFALWSDVTRSVTVKNRRTGMEINLYLKKGVNRIFTTNGVLNYGFEQMLPLYIGINELEIKINGITYVTLFLKKKESECGVYLKWFNQNGSWSYWRFSPIFENRMKTKTIEEINTNFKNLENSNGNFAILGKEAELEQRLKSGYIDRNELKVLNQILTSPRVFLYANNELEPFQPNDFKIIDVNDGTDAIENNKNQFDEYDITIKLPKIQTQTL